VLAIILLAVVIVGSVQIALTVLNVPQYIFPAERNRRRAREGFP
jgi:hypothetical protein